VTVGELDNPIKVGFLQKRGETHRSWKNRYFVLKGDKIYYFVSEDVNFLTLHFFKTSCKNVVLFGQEKIVSFFLLLPQAKQSLSFTCFKCCN
jgi:hypothetical protein